LGITRAKDNGLDLTGAAGRLGLVEDDFQCGEIRVTPRIGISKAADWPLRFFIAGNPCVSARGR
jgi:DNA-3-methyladenine glycosylase